MRQTYRAVPDEVATTKGMQLTSWLSGHHMRMRRAHKWVRGIARFWATWHLRDNGSAFGRNGARFWTRTRCANSTHSHSFRGRVGEAARAHITGGLDCVLANSWMSYFTSSTVLI